MKTNGFTLLEVIIAIAVSAVALIGIAGMVGNSHKNTAYLEKKIAADLAAQNLMDRHLFTFDNARHYPLKEESDTIAQGGFKLPYTQHITPAALPGLKKVDITIYDTDNESVLRKLTMYAGE